MIKESHMCSNVQQHVVLVYMNQFRDYPTIFYENHPQIEGGLEEVKDGHKPSDSLVGVTSAVNRDSRDS